MYCCLAAGHLTIAICPSWLFPYVDSAVSNI